MSATHFHQQASATQIELEMISHFRALRPSHAGRWIQADAGRCWILWWLCIGCAAALMAAAGIGAHVARAQRIEAKATVTAASLPRAVKPEAGPRRDFSAKLGPRRSATHVLSELQRVSQAHGVSLILAQFSELPASPHELSWLQASVDLQGPYIAAKRVVIDMLARYPSATVRSLQLRHESDTQTVSLKVLLVLWAAPAPAPLIDSAIRR